MKKVALYCVAIIVMPIIANFILFCINPLGKIIPVMGEISSWVCFYGSYLGALIGALAVFYTVKLTITNSNDAAQAERNVIYYKELRKDVSELVASIHYDHIMLNYNTNRYLFQGMEIKKANDMRTEIITLLNKVRMLYENEGTSEQEAFADAFIECAEQMIHDLEEYCRVIWKMDKASIYRDSNGNYPISTFHIQMKKLDKEIERHSVDLFSNKLGKTAIRFLDSEKNRLNIKF